MQTQQLSLGKSKLPIGMGILLNLVCWTFAFKASAFSGRANWEVGSPTIQNFIPKDYGGHEQVWSVAEDQRGVVYFSTTGGEIIEYDGTKWRVHRLSGKTTVRAVAVDRAGRIYYGAKGKFGYLGVNPDGSTSCVPLEGETKRDLGSLNDITKIIPTAHGVYFVSTRETFRWQDRQMSVLPVGARTAVEIRENIYLFSESAKKIGVIDQGLISYFSDTVFESETYGRVRVLLPLPQRDELLLFSPKRGLLLFSVKKQADTTDQETRIRPLQASSNDYFIQKKIYQAIELDSGRKAFVTGDGIVILNEAFEIVQIINDNHGLLTNTVYFVHQDRFKNLWVGLAGGIAYIHLSSPLTLFGKKAGVKSLVTATTRHQDSIYLGTFEMGPLKLPDYTLTVENKPHHVQSLEGAAASYAWSFLSVEDTLLVSSESVRRIDDGKISNIDGTPLAFTMSRSRRFKGRIYLGIAEPSGGGIGILDYEVKEDDPEAGETRTSFQYKGKVKGVKEVVHRIVEDGKGNLWCSTQQAGILRLRPGSDDPTDFEVERYNESHGLPTMHWNNVYLEQDRIMVATQKGVYDFIESQTNSVQENRFVPLAAINNVLESKEVTNIVSYGKDRWLLNPLDQNGILTRRSDNTYTIDNRPFRAVDVNPYVLPHIDSNGVVWTGMTTDLVRYDPNTKKNYATPYATVIRSVHTNRGKVLFGGTHYEPTSRIGDHFDRRSDSQHATQIPILEYEENGLTLEYSALFYEHPDRTRYKFYLVGFDPNWSDWSDKTLKEYTNIPEGTYTFKVKAKNIYGTESSVASYQFRILTPWYRSIWAYIGYGIGLLLLMFTGMRLNTRRLLAAKRRLQKIVEERTIEVVKQRDELQAQKKQIEEAQELIIHLEKETTERQMAGGFAHEIRNALVGAKMILKKIIHFTPDGSSVASANSQTLLELFSILKDNLEKEALQAVVPKIKTINNSEKQVDEMIGKLSASVNRSLAVTEQILTYAEVGQESAGNDEVSIDELFDEILREHAGLCAEHNIDIRLEGERDLRIKGNRLHFFMVFDNLIRNAREATLLREDEADHPRMIKITTRRARDEILVEVFDNGVGISSEHLGRIFEPFFTTNPNQGTGLGLGLVKKYISIYKGDIKFESKLNEGTTVIVSLPS